MADTPNTPPNSPPGNQPSGSSPSQGSGSPSNAKPPDGPPAQNKDEGTSRVTPPVSEGNNMMANPDKNPTATPGVLPTDPTAEVKTTKDGDAVRVAKDPEKKAPYHLLRGKHRWQDDKGGWHMAVAGDENTDVVWLNQRQADSLSGRFGLTPAPNAQMPSSDE